MNFQWRESEEQTVTLVNLLDVECNSLYNSSLEEASEALRCLDPTCLNALEGEFALATFAVDEGGQTIVVGARTIGVPARFAFQPLPPAPDGRERDRIFIAHTIREIRDAWLHQLPADVDLRDIGPFDPDYTEMLPAFYLVRVKPWAMKEREANYRWFLDTPEHRRPPREQRLPASVTEMGTAYILAAQAEVQKALRQIPEGAPIGIGFSGGADSGAIALLVIDALQKGGKRHPLHLFTLAIDGGGPDLDHARQFTQSLPAEYRESWQPIEVRSENLDIDTLRWEAARMIEDYGARDLECAMAGHVLLSKVRELYPEMRYLFDGDGGNEAFQDYPLEDPGYRRVRLQNVLEDPYLFYLGYARNKVPYSQTRSAGQSRGYVRTFNPARRLGFKGFSPFISRSVVQVAARFPLPDLAASAAELHGIRGKAVQAGIKAVLGVEMPLFEKVRFQEGVSSTPIFCVTPEHREQMKLRLKQELSLVVNTGVVNTGVVNRGEAIS